MGGQNAPSRKRTDWEAVERDYRTGRFTLRELEDKHGPTHTTVGRRAAKHGWTQDLQDAIRQATNAKLIAQSTQQECTNAHQNATDTVLAAAEVNTQVILRHRAKLAEVTKSADAAKAKVMTLLESAADIREVATGMGAVEAWARITKTVIDKEREAFGLNASDKPPASYEQSLQELGQ